MVFGTFDMLHEGHKFLLTEAKKRGDLTVVIARDAHVELLKKRAPAENEMRRQLVVQEFFPDANVVLGDEQDFLAPVRASKPDLILLGYDQKLPPGMTEQDLGCLIERLPPFEPERYKSSKMRSSSGY